MFGRFNIYPKSHRFGPQSDYKKLQCLINNEYFTKSKSWRMTHPSSKSRNKFCTNGLTPMLFIQLRNVFSSRVSSRFGISCSAGSSAGKLLNRLQTNARFSLAFPLTISLARTNLRHFILTALASTSSASLVGLDSLKCGWSTPRWAGAIWKGKKKGTL